MKYSIILPVYNQVQNLPIILYLLFEVAQKQKLNFEIIIVEDNSPDRTRQLAHKLVKFYQGKQQKQISSFVIKILERPGKLGLGSAYRDAIEKVQGQYVIIMDADLSHHPKYIPAMIEKLKNENADIVYSTRYQGDGGVQGWSFMRKLTSRTANYIASMVLGSDFSDLTGSFRLYQKNAFEQLIGQTTTKGYAFQMQMLIRGWKMGKKLVAQPIVFVDRLYGKSKLGPNQVFVYLQGVFKLFLTY